MMKRKVLTVGEKAEIIKKLETGEKNTTICKLYGLPSSTVSTLWKNKDKILQAFQNNVTESKRLKKCEKPDLDEALMKWFTSRKNAGLPMDGRVLRAQATKFAVEFGYENFVCTNGWIDRFKNRHNLKYAEKGQGSKSKSKAITRKLYNTGQDGNTVKESNSYNAIGESHSDFPDVITTEWLETMWLDYRSEYGDDDIYNAEEVGLFFNVTPDQMHRFKGKRCEEGEMLNNRMTVLLCTNMSGTDKRKLLVIGSLTKPNSLQHVKQLPVDYTSNLKAWMTPEIFTTFVQKWDSEMRRQNRRILLLIDHGPAHTKIPNLSNIKLVFVPPNSTSALQPMHQGIILCFKLNYRKELLTMLNERMKKMLDQQVSVLESLRMMNDAWYNVTAEHIRNCFVQAMLQWAEVIDEAEVIDAAEVIDDGSLISISRWLKQEKIDTYEDVSDIDDFISIDDRVQTSGILTVKEIVAEMKTPELPEVKEEVNNDEIPTLEAAFECADRLQSFFEAATSVNDDVFRAISLIRHELREQKDKARKGAAIDNKKYDRMNS